MANNTQSGFKACRKLGGGDAILKTYRVSAVANEAYFVGDAVTLGTSGRVRPLKNGSTTAPLGVIHSLHKLSNGKPAPLTFNMPTNGPFLTSAQEGFATVNIDPNQTYTVNIDANVTEASYGAIARVTAGAPTTQTGLSGQKLAATLTTGVSAGAQWQIIGLAPVELIESRTSIASQALVEVKMVQGVFGGNPV